MEQRIGRGDYWRVGTRRVQSEAVSYMKDVSGWHGKESGDEERRRLCWKAKF